MSVYKVISNYYNDLLNFLSVEDKQFNGLSNMFQKLTPDKKKMIVTKLSEMMLRFDSAFNNEISYWTQSKKEQNAFNIIYIVMLVITFCITVMMFIFRLKEIKQKGGNMLMVFKSLLSHIIIYQIILSVFVVLIVNMTSVKKLSEGQVELLKEDLRTYGGYVFTGASRDNLPKLFTFVGHWRRNNKARYKQIWTEMKNDSSLSGVLNLFPVIESTKSSKQTTSIPKVGKEVEVYDALKNDIENSLIRFYNNGQGYVDTKKLLLLASPILMLKEAKRMMNYYYFLGYKEKQTVTKESADKKEKDVIQDIVVKPLNNLLKDFTTSSADVDEVELGNVILLNEKNDEFKKNMDNLLKAFAYLALFGFPIYIKSNEKSPEFPYPDLLRYMPQNINVNGDVNSDKSFLEGVKTAFSKIHATEYQTILASTEHVDNTDTLLNELFLTLTPMFNDLYYRVFTNLEGGIWFPFNKKYITNKIFQQLRTGGAANLPDEYVSDVVEIIYNSIIQKVGSTFDILAVKRSQLVMDISSTLAQTKINILKFQNYIINSLIETNKTAKQYIEDIVELLNHVHKSVSIKRQLHNTQQLTNEMKFNEIEDFNTLVDNTTFQEMKEGLEVAYFKDVVDKFYGVISESVNMKRPNLRNIYYQKQKSFKVWKVTIIMMIIIIVLALVRFLVGLIETKQNIKYVSPERSCDRAYAERDYMNRNANWYIRLILPIFAMVFIIAMLISFHKKMMYAFDFNLDIIENNTNELKDALDQLDKKLSAMDATLDYAEKSRKISLISKITGDDKNEMLQIIKKIIDKFDKCNYIIESAKNQVPFPYAEVVIHGFMLVISVAAVLYVMTVFAPLKRIKDIKYMNKLKEELIFTNSIPVFAEKLNNLGTCHNDDMDGLVFSMKLIFFSFIIMFLMFYSIKIITAANEFKIGLYNSTYFDESRHYGE